MDQKDEKPDQVDDNQWMEAMKREVDGELDQVTSQLRESYTRLYAGLEKLDKEIAAAIEEGDEMKCQAAQIKKGLVEARLSELQALNIF